MDDCEATYTGSRITANTAGGELLEYTNKDTNEVVSGRYGAHGGGCFFGEGTTVSFADCYISDNTATLGGDGGGMYFWGGAPLSLIRCTVQNNVAARYEPYPTDAAAPAGGGICAGDGMFDDFDGTPLTDLTILDSRFTGNQAGYGGAVCASAATFIMDNSTVMDNIAEYGGGLYWHDSDATLTHLVLASNIAEDSGGAGVSGSGGALYCLNSSAVMRDLYITGNTAKGMGGGLFFSGPSLADGVHEVTNCLFSENVATFDGGGVSVNENAWPAFRSCTFAENKVLDQYGSGGAMATCNVFVDVEDCIFWDNLAVLGSQIGLGDPLEIDNPFTTVFIGYSDVQGGEDDIYIGAGDFTTWLWYRDGNIDADPLFAAMSDPNEPEDRTFYLGEIAAGQLADSPCLNAGYGLADDLADLLGFDDVTTRTDHVPDMGTLNMGYHYRSNPQGVRVYTLETEVYVADRFPHGKLVVITEPNNMWKEIDPETSHYFYRFKQGAVIELKAVPDENYRVARWMGSDDDLSYDLLNTITMTGTENVQVEFELAVPKNLYVPETYDTIEDAMAAARSGDTIILAPRPSQPYYITNPDGINFGADKYGNPKEIVITSVDPNDSLVVAQTIIDCQGSRYLSKRAFHFAGGQTSNSRVEGITVRNAFTAKIGLSAAIPTFRWPWWLGPDPAPWTVDPANPNPLPPYRALSGMDASGHSYGGAILCENGSSPVLRNCVFENCTVAGGVGGDGADGLYPAGMQNITEDLDSQSGGHSGKGTGNGYGGAIAVLSGSNPSIQNCTFRNNRATGGWGGIPGDAGTSYNNGRYGWGGNDPAGLAFAELFGINPQAGYGEGDGHGGAIYIAAGCDPTIVQCTFEGNYARPGYVSAGGAEAGGNAYPAPFDAQTVGAMGLPWGNAGARVGRDGMLLTNGTIAGGAIYIEAQADVSLEGCTFAQSQAYEVYTYNDPPVVTRGGAVYSDPNAIVRISDSVFSENIAGALYCATGVDLQVERTEFTNNLTDYPVEDTVISRWLDLMEERGPSAGGAVVPTRLYDISGGITVEVDARNASRISDCRFMGNVSYVGGGAIRTDSDMDLANCILNGNRSQDNGGAVYSFVEIPDPNGHTTKLMFENCELGGNDAQGYGGAVFVKNCILTLNDCFLISNTAFSGGAVRMSAGDLTMKGCLIYGNEATGVIPGSHRTVVAEGFGGGVHVTDTPFSIVDTRFQNNSADGILSAGGGLCVNGSQTYYEQNLLNCLFADNRSDNIGGGMACRLYVDVLLDNCTFAGNASGSSQGGALYVDHLSRAAMKDAIVSGNTGIGIYEKAGGNSQISYTLFNANAGGDMRNGADGLVYAGNTAPDYTNNKIGNPQFATGPLGMYYLNQTASPAINAGSRTAIAAGLNTFTTSPDGTLDAGQVDLGYHYDDPEGIEAFNLTTSFRDETGAAVSAGTITPASGMFLRGAVLELSADVQNDYFLTGWSGETINDNSLEAKNTVLMARDKDIRVVVRLRRTLTVGASTEYDTLGDAIYAAQDGDTILVVPGEYTSASQHISSANTIFLTGKKITISGTNPDDENIVRATVFRDYDVILEDLDSQTVIEGITFNQSRMDMLNSDAIIRNCVFSECRFDDDDEIHLGTVPAGTDGYHQQPIFGGAMRMFDSSPQVINCTFEDNSVTGADGENGFAGAATHPTGGDGGWPGAAYGGAVYCAFSSRPQFIHCTFTGNEVVSGNGGNGANGWVGNGVVYDGGRGGGWLYDPEMEAYLRLIALDIWDGWANNSPGDKYGAWSIYSPFYGEYDMEVWARWFGWGDAYSSWEDFWADYSDNPEDPLGDPYDQMLDVWRYSGFGGAVYCEFDSDAAFRDCVFENNQSHGGLTGIGGLIDGETSRPDRQLNMPTAGGAVYAAHDSDLEFTGCVFRSNVADKSTVELPHTFQVSFGGAVAYEFNCNVTFDDCAFEDNDATVGGGMYGRDSLARIADCNVFSNEAYLGAGIFLDMEEASVTNTLFHANRAQVPAGTDTIDQTGIGGGLFASVGNLDIRDSMFARNTSDISGGGLLLSGVVDEPTAIFNCLFTENTAGRDGAGASVNWDSIAEFGNCTFADNSALGFNGFTGSGGGLYLGYDSDAVVTDSIFWGNEATQGQSITVGTGFEFDPRPSRMTISYADVANYPSANAIYVGPGCTLDAGAGLFSASPQFVTSPEAEVDDMLQRYYLDQELSPCIDAGSTFASALGMNNYTTSIFGALDKGLVDLGYHYPLAFKTQCSLADLILSGKIDLYDWAEFASGWLMDPCGQDNDWCNGADLNFDTVVNTEDFSRFVFCWLTQDAEPPFPSPAEWAMEPNAVPGTFNTIEMLAETHHDAWWPDANIRYYFDCIQPADGPDRGWSADPYWSKTGVAPGTYRYVLRVRDGSHNVTLDSVEAIVTPGEKTVLPKAEWLRPPFIMGAQFAIQMEALAYEDFGTIGTPLPALPAGYVIKYQYEYTGAAPGGDNRGYAPDPVYVDTGMVEGQTYSYRVRMGLFYEPGDGSSAKIMDGDWSDVAAVVALMPDLAPPLPNPSQHASGSPFQTYMASQAQYYHVVTAVEAADGSGVEYKFICSDSSASSGGLKDPDGIEWRNADNVAGLFYPNGQAQMPRLYWSKIGLVNQTDKVWYIVTRDRSPNQNTGQQSVGRTIASPQP
ncbi:MAG: right-handed parallel beta-helix repeat-containing protein [Planctomycetales bacterium]|nr:right-handed parallel beta-helix repeat-containing protein [Planctomycetales bacterium]